MSRWMLSASLQHAFSCSSVTHRWSSQRKGDNREIKHRVYGKQQTCLCNT